MQVTDRRRDGRRRWRDRDGQIHISDGFSLFSQLAGCRSTSAELRLKVPEQLLGLGCHTRTTSACWSSQHTRLTEASTQSVHFGELGLCRRRSAIILPAVKFSFPFEECYSFRCGRHRCIVCMCVRGGGGGG